MAQRLHHSTFQYLRPTDRQMEQMAQARAIFAHTVDLLGDVLPDGADTDYVLRLIRDAGMWANVAITRHPDGTPRTDR